jgi:hypothetical protein
VVGRGILARVSTGAVQYTSSQSSYSVGRSGSLGGVVGLRRSRRSDVVDVLVDSRQQAGMRG